MPPLLLLAAQTANLSRDPNRQAFVGALAIRDDGKIVKARNGISIKTPTETCPSVHAESKVIRKSGFGATVFVARVLRNGTIALAKPCSTCQVMLKNMRVKKVYYTTGPDSFDSMVLK